MTVNIDVAKVLPETLTPQQFIREIQNFSEDLTHRIEREYFKA